MSEQRYNPRVIESRWQAIWESEKTWEVGNAPSEKPKSYIHTSAT